MSTSADDARECPWCNRWSLKDNACMYVVCGRRTQENPEFVPGTGCARAWCFECGGKLCGPPMYHAETGEKLHGDENHHHPINSEEWEDCHQEGYCAAPGNSHNNHR